MVLNLFFHAPAARLADAAAGAITDAHDDVTPLRGARGVPPGGGACPPTQKCNWVDPVDTDDDRAARGAGRLYLRPG